MPAEEPAVADRRDDASLLKWRKRTRLLQQVLVGLDSMLERWDKPRR